MSLLWPHRFWFALLAISLALIFISLPLLRMAATTTVANLTELKTQQLHAEQTLQQLRSDTETAQKLQSEMTMSEAEQSLEPVDRLLAANIIEREADAAHIYSFSYTLAPEQKIKMAGLTTASQELAVSTITVRGEAPDDMSVYGFIDGMRGSLPGRVRLQQMSLVRSNKSEPVSAYNLRFNATFEWLSNGTAPDMVSGI